MAMSGIRRSALATALWACSLIALPLAAVAETPAKISPASGAENADFDVYFPLRDETAVHALIDAQIRPGSPQYHRWLTPQQFQRRLIPATATWLLQLFESTDQGVLVRGTSALPSNFRTAYGWRQRQFSILP